MAEENHEHPQKKNIPDRSMLEKTLGLFSEVRSGEGPTGLLLLANIFLVLTAYYLIKPVREGWISISLLKGLQKIEIKAYSSFGQSLLLLLIIPVYTTLTHKLSRRSLVTVTTLFFVLNMLIFWILRPGFLAEFIPYAGLAFYLWVGVFSVTVVVQFWSFAVDLYSEERGKRLVPLIAVGASAGAMAGSWITEKLIKLDIIDTYDLILMAAVPLLLALLLTRLVDRRERTSRSYRDTHNGAAKPAAPDPTDAFTLVFKSKYLLAIAFLSLLINWVNTNGENILFGVVQETLEEEIKENGITSEVAATKYVKNGTTAFYSNLYFWINLIALILQAFFASRLLKYGGVASILLITPLVSLFSYAAMLFFPMLVVLRVMKVAENSTNYSFNNTARHVLWLPATPTEVYKGKALVDTFFMRFGDALAALTVLVGTQMLALHFRNFLVFNVFLACLWTLIGVLVVLQHRRLVRNKTSKALSGVPIALQEGAAT